MVPFLQVSSEGQASLIMPRCPLDLGFPQRGATELESGAGFSRLKGSASSADASPELYLSPPTAGHQGLDMQAVLRGPKGRDMLPGMNFTFHPRNYSQSRADKASSFLLDKFRKN